MTLSLLKVYALILFIFCAPLFAEMQSTAVPIPAAELTPTQTVLSATPSEKSVYSEKVRFVAKVVPTYVPGSLPSGSIQFFINKELLATQPIVNNIASFTTDTLPASSSPYHLTAIYPGDNLYAASKDYLDFYVLPAHTAVKLSSRPNPSTWSEPIRFTVAVASQPPSKAIPQGSVQLRIAGDTTHTLLLDQKGYASYTTRDLEVGGHVVTASFLGDANFIGSTNRISQQVDKVATTLSITSSENPSTYGKATQIVAKAGSHVKDKIPTGDVQFELDGQEMDKPVQLSTEGIAQTTFPNLSAGNHQIVALYNGDEHFHPSNDDLIQQIQKAITKSTLTSSENPSVYGSTVTFTDTVTAEYRMPTGAVTVGIDGNIVWKQALDHAGTAGYTVDNFNAGKHTISTDYLEDANFKESSARIVQEVNKADSMITITPSENPSIYGSTVAFTAYVTSAQMNPIGFVQFIVDNKKGETKKIVGKGHASIEIANFEAGNHTLVANYLGDVNFNTSSASLVQQVQKADTQIALSSSENPSTYRSRVSFMATVSSQGPLPSGSVQFLVDGKPVETKKLDSNSKATLTITSLDAGDHDIVVNFLENASFNASSTHLIQQVQKAATLTTLTSSKNHAIQDSEVTFMAKVIADKGKPAGTVSFQVDESVVAETTLDEQGEAQFTSSALEPGKHQVAATYLGNSNYAKSSASFAKP